MFFNRTHKRLLMPLEHHNVYFYANENMQTHDVQVTGMKMFNNLRKLIFPTFKSENFPIVLDAFSSSQNFPIGIGSVVLRLESCGGFQYEIIARYLHIQYHFVD